MTSRSRAMKKQEENALRVATEERARRAVSRFRKMIPSLNSYVRAVSGNPKLKIVITKDNGSSIRNKIFFQPPIALGDELQHDRYMCDRRDEKNLLICKACRTDENIMALIYHEIGHVAFGTHDTPSNYAVRNKIEELAPLVGGKPSTALAGYIAAAKALEDQGEQGSWMLLAALLNSHMGKLFNATEDARVNERIFRARRGVRTMYNSLMADILDVGVPIPGTDEYVQWADMASNHQMCLAVNMRLEGHNFATMFQQEVVDDLNDPELSALLDTFDPSDTVSDNLKFTAKVMQRLMAMGYFLPEKSEDGKEEGEAGSSDDSDSADDGNEDDQASDGGNEEGSGEQSEDESDADSQSGDGDNSGDSGESKSGDSSGEQSECGGEQQTPGGSDAGGASGAHGQGGYKDSDSDSQGKNTDDNDRLEDLPDTGANTGGIKLHSAPDHARYGDSGDEGSICIVDMSEIAQKIEKESKTEGAGGAGQAEINNDAMQLAIIQGMYFETPSTGVHGVTVLKPDNPNYRGSDGARSRSRYVRDLDQSEMTQGEMNNAVMHARVVFDENQRAKQQRNLKKGKINGRSLAKRVPFNDDRIFRRKIIPGKRDYHVTIGMDISYSTVGVNLQLEKQAVLNQAELLNRLGIPFSIQAHSSGSPGGGDRGWGSGYQPDLLVFEVKTTSQPWDTERKENLNRLEAVSGNLDGHFLEYLRKRSDEAKATDKIILYYSDGKMPAENHDEELEVLQREIKTCRQRGIHLLGVGIRTDSPTEHGLETVQIDNASEVGVVIDQLKRHLLTKV